MKRLRENILPMLFVLIVLLVAVAASSNRRIRMKTGDSYIVHCEASNPNLRPLGNDWQEHDWLLTCEWGLD